MKRIIICADGTWNRPEDKVGTDFPTNVMKYANAIKPIASEGTEQVVFYDWGLGSYHDENTAGAIGTGIDKNIKDNYRFIVQNYAPGDEIFLFGFSRGAYTVRSLCGLINNCGILKRKHAKWIETAYRKMYRSKKESRKPEAHEAIDFRDKYSHASRKINFVGVWDTVGALGIPLGIFKELNENKYSFHNDKIGPNVKVARHALSIDELRKPFKPTIWKERAGVDLKQVWFAGVHADIGGSYKPDDRGMTLSDTALEWMMNESKQHGIAFEPHLKQELKYDAIAKKHNQYKGLFYKSFGPHVRKITPGTYIHKSVKKRFEQDTRYRPDTLMKYLRSTGATWPHLKP